MSDERVWVVRLCFMLVMAFYVMGAWKFLIWVLWKRNPVIRKDIDSQAPFMQGWRLGSSAYKELTSKYESMCQEVVELDALIHRINGLEIVNQETLIGGAYDGLTCEISVCARKVILIQEGNQERHIYLFKKISADPERWEYVFSEVINQEVSELKISE